MTIDQAIEKLRTTPRDWLLSNDGAIRRVQEWFDFTNQRHHENEQCPLAAITSEYALSVLPTGHADDLGMKPEDALAVVQAADYQTLEGKRTLLTEAEHQALRRRILEACGLGENQNE